MSSNDAVGELICPITGEVFLDPVLLVGDGHTYEREAAERWLAKHATSPLSGQPLPPHGLDLVPNHALRKQASALLERRPDLRPVPGAWCAKEDAKGAAGAGADASPLGSRSPGCGGGEEDEVGAAKRRAQAEAGFSSRVDASSTLPPPLPVPRRRPRGHARRRCAELRPVDARARRRGPERPLAPSRATRTRPLPRPGRRRLRLRLGHLQLIHRSHLATPDRHRRLSSRADRRHRARLGDVRGRLPRRRPGRRRGSLRNASTAYRVGDGGGGAGAGAVIVSSESLRADADAPWHKDFVTCVARDGDASVVYGAEDWTPRARLRARRRRDRAQLWPMADALTSVPPPVSSVARDAGLIIVGADDGRTFFFDARAGTRPCTRARTGRVGSPRDESRFAAVAARSDGFGFFVGTPGGAHLLEGPRASRARARTRRCGKDGECRRGGGGSRGSGLVVATGGRGLGGRGRPGAWSASWEDGAVVDAAGGAWTEDDAPPTSVVAFEATPLAAATREAAVGDENRPKKGFLPEMVRGVMARRRKSAKERDGEEQYL